jgi:hypothetical protein
MLSIFMRIVIARLLRYSDCLIVAIARGHNTRKNTAIYTKIMRRIRVITNYYSTLYKLRLKEPFKRTYLRGFNSWRLAISIKKYAKKDRYQRMIYLEDKIWSLLLKTIVEYSFVDFTTDVPDAVIKGAFMEARGKKEALTLNPSLVGKGKPSKESQISALQKVSKACIAASSMTMEEAVEICEPQTNLIAINHYIMTVEFGGASVYEMSVNNNLRLVNLYIIIESFGEMLAINWDILETLNDKINAKPNWFGVEGRLLRAGLENN